jgi:hypothetical protein
LELVAGNFVSSWRRRSLGVFEILCKKISELAVVVKDVDDKYR